MNPREEVLSRISNALIDAASQPVPVDRNYRRRTTASGENIVGEFVERAEAYGAKVRRCDETGLRDMLGELLAERSAKRVVLPEDFPGDWLPPGIKPLIDPGLTPIELDEVEGAITGCAVAIAQTGTIVLDGGRLQGRRALSLVPDYLLCLVSEEQIVGLVAEGIEATRQAAGEGRPITFITGPSATSDIELVRVEGVHGPRRLDLIIFKTGAGERNQPVA